MLAMVTGRLCALVPDEVAQMPLQNFQRDSNHGFRVVASLCFLSLWEVAATFNYIFCDKHTFLFNFFWSFISFKPNPCIKFKFYRYWNFLVGYDLVQLYVENAFNFTHFLILLLGLLKTITEHDQADREGTYGTNLAPQFLVSFYSVPGFYPLCLYYLSNLLNGNEQNLFRR